MEAFKPYGAVLSANVVTDRETGRSRGFGFVEFETDEAAAKAAEAMNDTELGGRRIRVNEATPRGGGGGGGYRGGGGGGGGYRGGGGGGGGGGGRRRGGRKSDFGDLPDNDSWS